MTFIDNPTIPIRLETLLEVIIFYGKKKLNQKQIVNLLQPNGLPDLREKSNQAKDHLNAAMNLNIIEKDGDIYNLNKKIITNNAKQIIIEACDKYILNDNEVNDLEPYFAWFYSYLLGQNKEAKSGDGTNWEYDFNKEFFPEKKASNQFNNDKYIQFLSWYRYLGLGWRDPNNSLQPNPYERVKRTLPKIFEKLDEITIDDFMGKLAQFCPELDGGTIFIKANAKIWKKEDRVFTRGLGRAMYELHIDKVIELQGIKDATYFWNIKDIDIKLEESIKSTEISNVKYLSRLK